MSSAEPGWKAPYSVDLRWRVMWQKVVHDLSFEDIGRRLGIASSTAHRIFALFTETGEVEPKGTHGARRYLRKLDEYMEMFVIAQVKIMFTIKCYSSLFSSIIIALITIP